MHAPSGVARADRDRRYDCFVHEYRTFWNGPSREGGSAFPVQKERIREDTVVGEELLLGGTRAVDPVPGNATRSGDVSGNQIRCCASENGTCEVGVARGSANVRGVAQESVAKGVEVGGSHNPRWNPAVTYAWQTLHAMVPPLVQWDHLKLGLGVRLAQKSRGYCQMGGHSPVCWSHCVGDHGVGPNLVFAVGVEVAPQDLHAWEGGKHGREGLVKGAQRTVAHRVH